jgi:hypothetical protein
MANNVMKVYNQSFSDFDLENYTLTTDYEDEENAIKRNRNYFAETSGKAGVAFEVDYDIDIKFDHDIDAVVLNSNLSAFKIFYYDTDWRELVEFTDNAKEFLVYEFSTITANKIRVRATQTITPDEEKRINLIEITKKLCEIDIETIGIEKGWQRTNFDNVFGGSIQVVKYANHGKIAIDLSFKNLTGNNFLAYALIKSYSVIAPLNVYLYFSDTYELLNEEAWYLVNDISDYDGSPTGEALTQGCSGSLKLREC